MKWDKKPYQQIVSAALKRGQLEVGFEDGSVVEIDPERLLPRAIRDPRWENLRHTANAVVVPTATGEFEISWSSIRALTDPEYRGHLERFNEVEVGVIGRRLKELREQKGIISKELAAKAGITPQSLSRIENGHHDIAFNTLQKLLSAMGHSVRDLAEVSYASPVDRVFRRLQDLGFDSEFLSKRLLPRTVSISPNLDEASNAKLLAHALMPIERIFGWTFDDIVGQGVLKVNPKILATTNFKTPGRTQQKRATIYTVYANFLAAVIASAIEVPQKPLPSAEEIRTAIVRTSGVITFESLLDYLWSLGIPVIPLQDPGAFHGACWNIDGRPVIVLKQLAGFHARWLYDLAHECGHIFSHMKKSPDSSVVEGDEISPFSGEEKEEQANDFAEQLLFFGRAEELAEKCVDVAHNKVELLKTAVARVSSNEKISTDLLANYLAFRLGQQGINWWGAANNLQENDPPPWEIAGQRLIHHLNMNKLAAPDKDLVLRALGE